MAWTRQVPSHMGCNNTEDGIPLSPCLIEGKPLGALSIPPPVSVSQQGGRPYQGDQYLTSPIILFGWTAFGGRWWVVLVVDVVMDAVKDLQAGGGPGVGLEPQQAHELKHCHTTTHRSCQSIRHPCTPIPWPSGEQRAALLAQANHRAAWMGDVPGHVSMARHHTLKPLLHLLLLLLDSPFQITGVSQNLPRLFIPPYTHH